MIYHDAGSIAPLTHLMLHWRNRTMIPFVKTIESPCRTCENIDRNKEECAEGCAKLGEFQRAILRNDEINIKNFQVRYSFPSLTRKVTHRVGA
jgi:hypothetical protein